MTAKEKAAVEGVERAWDFWLGQHPVSVPEIIEEAIKKAFAAWLDEHSDEIVAAIAARGSED